MLWDTCRVCNEIKESTGNLSNSRPITKVSKFTNFHEPSEDRDFRIRIIKECNRGKQTVNDGLENTSNKEKWSGDRIIDFYVDLMDLLKVCPYFEQFKEVGSVEFSTNCFSTQLKFVHNSNGSNDCLCHLESSSPLIPAHFHAFLEATCPSFYSIRPVDIQVNNIIPIIDVLSHFSCEPLMTNCERFLMSTNVSQLEISTLVKLIDKGMRISLDHRILGRILCVVLMNSSKLADFSQELSGKVGAVFAQAFVTNAAKGFRHIKPIDREPVCTAVRNLILNNSSSGKTSKKQKRRKNICDHTEESFECILCFDTRCSKCKGEAAFCYKALDNFLYEIRLQLYNHTYRTHMDREMLREDCINNYILQHQLLPIPDQ